MAESDLNRKDLRRTGEALVYATLHRMAADGLIVGEWAICDGRRRRHYRLTEVGRQLLELSDHDPKVEQRNQWQEFVEATSAVLRGVQTCPNPI